MNRVGTVGEHRERGCCTAFYLREVIGISGLIDSGNVFSDQCKPVSEIPSWWSGFLFHVLNTRQVSLYLYLSMLTSTAFTCHPTTKQIRQDLGLASLTIVFESMSVLENYGFILRQRRKVEHLSSRRNVYQRPSCEFTILRLIELGKIDGLLRPTPGFMNEMSEESAELREEWLENLLGDTYASFSAGTPQEKHTILVAALHKFTGIAPTAAT